MGKWAMRRQQRRMGVGVVPAPAVVDPPETAVVDSSAVGVAEVEENSAPRIRPYTRKSGMYVCSACGYRLKTEMGILDHIEREHG